MSNSEKLIFDYTELEYKDIKGNIINIPYENFPCSRCKSPSRLDANQSEFEVYKCTECNHSFSIN